jgi:uncharacterized membrane protein YhaH (DUF805 family)
LTRSSGSVTPLPASGDTKPAPQADHLPRGEEAHHDVHRRAFSKYATFSGRSSRAAYWWFHLFALIAVIAALVVDVAIGTGGIVYGLVALALFLPNLAVTVRRLHDSGRSGWWLLIGLVPIVGFIVLLIFTLQGSDAPNHWGYGPDDASAHSTALA